MTGSSGYVGHMLQKDLLLPWKTVINNIVLGSVINGGASQTLRPEEFINHYPAALSGDMRQR